MNLFSGACVYEYFWISFYLLCTDPYFTDKVSPRGVEANITDYGIVESEFKI